MWDIFEPRSSPIDWCEGNYTVTPLIAEFVNTVSNILFILLPPILMYLFYGYGKSVNSAIHIVWALFIVVGLSSAYFHATLSLVGQLLDELSIIYLFFAAFAVFFPRRFLPTFIHNRKIFNAGTACLAGISTALALKYAAVNAFFLMALAIPSVVLLVYEIRRTKNHRAKRLAIRSILVWGFGALCWITDKFFCEAWTSINFPYGHSLWHICIFIACYTAGVFLAYVETGEEAPNNGQSVLKYWPLDEFEWGIPYVHINHFH